MSLQISLNHLEGIKHTKIFAHKIKYLIKNLIPELVNVEKQYYDKLFDSQEQTTSEVYDVYNDFLNEMANVPIYDCQNLITIYKAYQKDPKSIEGIVNKILK